MDASYAESGAMLSRLCESMVFDLRANMLSQQRESMAPAISRVTMHQGDITGPTRDVQRSAGHG